MNNLTIKDELTEFLLYTTPNSDIKVETYLHNETLWFPQKKIANLFGVQRPAITKHLKNIFESGELEEKEVSSILEHTTKHGAIDGKTQVQEVKYYNLDVILSVGYRSFTMQSLSDSVNKFLEFNEYDEFSQIQKIESDFDKRLRENNNEEQR